MSLEEIADKVDKMPMTWTANHTREAFFLQGKIESKKALAGADGVLTKKED